MLKLTDEQVRCIRRDYAAAEGSYETLGRKYGCSYSTIRDIVKGRTRTKNRRYPVQVPIAPAGSNFPFSGNFVANFQKHG